MPRFIARALALLTFLLAIPLYATEIPKSLEEWKAWVLESHPDINCPFLYNDAARACTWPSELKIEAGAKGASFTQHTEVFKEAWIALPGDKNLWPQGVTINGSGIAVRDNEGVPEIYLTKGVYDIKGEIRWSDMPRTLQTPKDTGIVQLTLNGKAVSAPSFENNNQLWLTASEKQNATAHQDSFELRVFRKIEDTIPLRVVTQLQLDVSGKERELQLGQLLPTGFTPINFSSPLPARLEKNGDLHIQVKPGSWTLELTSQSTKPQKTLSFKTTSALWPQQEIWVFSAERQLRSVQISGAQTIDPQQTQLPDAWKSLPAYLVTPDTQFTLEELQRGEGTSLSNELKLDRHAWLSFSGDKFIFRDTISGNAHTSRLETLKPLELTNANIDGQPQLITQLNNSANSGIEIRSRNLNVDAVSQMPKAFSIPVSGWNEELNKVGTTLYLPPGWSLFTASGTSSDYGSWVSRWTLWDLFTVLIIVVAIARVTTPIGGALAAVALILIYQRTAAPVFIWLNLIAALALATFVSGKFKQFIQRYIYLSFILLALVLLPFCVREARIFINPQLENEYFWDWTEDSLYAIAAQSSDKKKPAPAAAPAPAPAAAAIQDESLDEVVVTGAKAERKNRLEYALQKEEQRSAPVKIQRAYDPSQKTQTGVAVPSFNESSVYLQWDGPVKADETTRLYLVSPWINRLGHLLAVLLPLALAGLLLQHTQKVLDKKFTLPGFNPRASASALVILLAGFLALPAQQAEAQVNIDPAILKELETRLTKEPVCLPNCAAIESANLKVQQDQLTLEMVVHSGDLIALPLPADRDQWWPNQVIIDGKTATLVQTDSELLISLPKGRHNVSIKADLQGRDALNLNFPVPLHNVTTNTSGWEISGVPTQEQASQSLQLQRVEQDSQTAKSEHLRPDPIAPFVIVRRELNFDLEWTLVTRVVRVAPEFGVINIEVPVLDGESPLSTQLNDKGKVAVHLEANQNEFEWNSTLKQVTPLQLKAAENVPWIEIWALSTSSLWHTDTSGIAPVQMDKNQYLPLWQPWPGETLNIAAQKPKATKGTYVTIDWANINYQPGNRSSLNDLSFMIRTNQGGQYSFKLPADAQLSKVAIDGQEQIVAPSNGVLKLPLRPGSQTINLQWKSSEGLGLLTRSPAFVLEQGSSNQTISIQLPDNRWPLFVGGPLMGPSILLWGLLIVVSLVGYVLGRSGLTPLKSYEWILLGVGICTLSFGTFVLVALWLIALHKRGQLHSIATSLRFKLLQIALFILSVWALGSLVTTLPDGLLGSPDMHVLGNRSYADHFQWYQDYSELDFPRAWAISLPLWCYKLVMLVWALWLASALLRWVRWGWQQLSHQALWYAPESIVLKPKNAKEEKRSTPVSTPPQTDS